MTARNYTNTHVATTLASGITGATTAITPTSLSGLPASYPYYLILDYGTAQVEVVLVGSSAGSNLNVTRGQDGTLAQNHDAGASIVHGVVAADVKEPQDHMAASSNVHGIGAPSSVVGTATAQTLTNKTISGSGNTLTNIGNASLSDIAGSKVTMPIPTLTVTNNATVGGTLGVTSNTTVGGTLGITGTTTAAAVNAGAVTCTTLGASSNATVGGTLGITGTTTAAAVNAGAVTCTTLGASSNATVGGTLGITGTTTAATVNCTVLAASSNATVGGTLGITGATTAAAVTGTTINGTTDVQRNGVSLPRGYVTSATTTTELNTTTTETVFLTVSFTAVTGRRYKVTFQGAYTGTSHNDEVKFDIKYQSGASLTAGGSTSIRTVSPTTVNPSPPSGGAWIPLCFSGTTTALTNGTFTVGVTFKRQNGTGTVYSTANAVNVARIEVEDIGV